MSHAETSEVKSTRVSDELAAIADISGTLAGTPVKGSHMLVFSGDNSLYAMALCPPDQWETLSPTLKAMLASLAYLEP